jgi:hypothetical protein
MNEAIATLLPAWVGVWMNILLLGAFVAPLVLLIWKDSRMIAIAAIVAGIASAIGVTVMYGAAGYTKLLGLPHILFYTPLVYGFWQKLQSGTMAVWPTRIAWVVLITVLISLAFDYTDALRYLFGDRAALPGTV